LTINEVTRFSRRYESTKHQSIMCIE